MKRQLLPRAVLAASLGLTALTVALIASSTATRDRAQFQTAAHLAQDRITSRMATYVALLDGARGLFEAEEMMGRVVTRREFNAYVEHLGLDRNFPGIRAIGYAHRATREELPALYQFMGTQGAAGFHIWPWTVRDDYFPILYIAPLDLRNIGAIGYDMFTERTRREAMAAARDAGTARASGRVALVQEIDHKGQLGFLVYTPVYRGGVPGTIEARRRDVAGFVYAAFRTGDLMRGIFRNVHPSVDIWLYDGPAPDSSRLLASLVSQPDATPLTSTYTTTGVIYVAGRPMTLEFRSAPEPLALRQFGALLTGLLGLAVSVAFYRAMRGQVAARDAAERSDALRSRFFAAMSHELRTPLNAIIGYNDLLLAGVHGPLNDDVVDGIERSQRAAFHLRELVSDVLDLSKIEAGKIELVTADVDIADVVDELFSTIAPIADKRGCVLSYDHRVGRGTLHTDPRRLRQILLNLLSNAIKFGAGHPVTVTARDQRGGGVRISVRDHGPGISAADQERIFEEFVQLGQDGHEGTGLGLAISQRLARVLGGTLVVRSAPGEGATFVLSLPEHAPTTGVAT